MCSCVYPARPEIVTELRKQFTVNKPFPPSNKGPMRLNSVPAGAPPRVMKNSEFLLKQSAPRRPFYRFPGVLPGLPTTARSLQLASVRRRVAGRYSGSHRPPRDVPLPERRMTNEGSAGSNGGPR